MASIKRKAPGAGLGGLLQRRVKARIEPEPESDIEHSDSEGAPSEEDFGSEGSGSEDEEEEDASGSEEESDAESEASNSDRRDRKSAADAAAQLSFGALVKAQAALGAPGRKKRRGSNDNGDAEDDENPDDEDGGSSRFRESKDEFHKKVKAVPKRTSKHAPVEMSSKKPVSRKRDFIEVHKPQARDPRFGPLGAGHGYSAPIDEAKLRKAYSFLDEYQETEMKQLREAIKKTKDPQEKEKLSRALMSMESKKKARLRKDKERQLLEEHRKQEKELVKQGKQPFYLKKSEQKKRLLVDQFANMKKGQVDKAIERKRKKVAGREKKALPMARRTAEDRH